MKIATDIASWNAEARKHHLSYGQYERAVEHGELPPPKAHRKPDAKKIIRRCIGCGKEFEVERRASDGYISQAKYCLCCRSNAQHGRLRGDL